MPLKKQLRPRNPLNLEYVTCTVTVFKGDGIGIDVVNDSPTKQTARVIIYQTTGAGAVVAHDTGNVALIPTWQWSLGFTVPTAGEYWVRIGVSSEFLIPGTTFEREQAGIWVPVVSYRPGDFAVFQLSPRKRIW